MGTVRNKVIAALNGLGSAVIGWEIFSEVPVHFVGCEKTPKLPTERIYNFGLTFRIVNDVVWFKELRND